MAEIINYADYSTEAELNDFPYFVALITENSSGGRKIIGSATIIHDKWLLTGAACIDALEQYSSKRYAYCGKFPNKIIFKKLIKHEQYDRETLKHDIGLIETETSLLLQETCELTIPDEEMLGKCLTSGKHATSVGFRENHHNLFTIGNLEKHIFYIMNGLHPYPNIESTDIIYAKPYGPPQFSKSIRGGPLVVDYGRLVGIVSLGRSCQKDFKFTKVQNYKQWIESHINAHKFSSTIKSSNLAMGGRNTVLNEFPFYVVLININDANVLQVIGGASIIHDRWLLTAAHCIDILNEYGGYGVYANSGKLYQFPKRIQFKQYIKHEAYNELTNLNDIGLIETSKSMLEIEGAREIVIPDMLVYQMAMSPPVELTAIGYGRISLDGPPSMRLKKVTLDTILGEIPEYPNYDPKTMICAMHHDSKMLPYVNDSGGPLVTTYAGLIMLVGVIAFGPKNGPKDKLPAGFIKAPFYKDWIETKTGIKL